MGVFVAGVPSSLAPRTPFFSPVNAPLPLSRLRLLRRLFLTQTIKVESENNLILEKDLLPTLEESCQLQTFKAYKYDRYDVLQK